MKNTGIMIRMWWRIACSSMVCKINNDRKGDFKYDFNHIYPSMRIYGNFTPTF